MPDIFYHSAEIRWFLPGQGQRDQVLSWFMVPGHDPVIETTDYTQRRTLAHLWGRGIRASQPDHDLSG